MLKQLLTPERICCVQSTPDWQSAIRIAASPLLKAGDVTQNYVDAMISSVEKHGAYIVIDEGLALPHARPEEGAVNLGLSMLILSEPVDMLGNPVSVLVALSAVDNNSHIDAMRQLAELIWAGCDAKTLSAAKTVEDALNIIKRYIKEEV